MLVEIHDEENQEELVLETDDYEFSVKGVDGVISISINLPRLLKLQLTEKETRVFGNAVTAAAAMTKNQGKSDCGDCGKKEKSQKEEADILPNGEDEPYNV